MCTFDGEKMPEWRADPEDDGETVCRTREMLRVIVYSSSRSEATPGNGPPYTCYHDKG